MSTVRSLDSTEIAFERTGEGPPVIMLGGALNDQSVTAPLAELLSPRFTVLNYDRRGRGASGNSQPYSVEREVEDLARMLEEAGGSAAVFANCSGGAIAIEAAARGLPITKLALYEPPYILEGQREKIASDYPERIGKLLDEDRRGEAVRYFMGEAVRLPAEVIDKINKGEMWGWLEHLAPSLRYDAAVMGDYSMPVDRVARITVPTLAMDGAESPQWARNTVQFIADTVANGQRTSLEKQNHTLSAEAVGPVLEKFFSE